MSTKQCQNPLALCIYELTRVLEGLKKEIKNREVYVDNIKPRILSKTELELKEIAELGLRFLIDTDPQFRKRVEKRFVRLLRRNESKPNTLMVLWLLTYGGVEVSEETQQALAEFKADPYNKVIVDLCMYSDI